ncbi:hypothetical protein NU10_13720 [Flavobacterium dauae]|uniref:hypothetical protein n=1 Tax=Flavobacterium dauae TaxID=1563479 RepID=UPI00101BFD97|nr:hypothetical protein [Flavobacterium dauae]WLD23745.1 hypothetical protein NU10_13720 [Flavobacterium dauae]
MIYRYLILIVLVIGCTTLPENVNKTKPLTKDEEYKDYVLQLHEQNLYQLEQNKNIINILSVKHNIPLTVCNKILSEYLNMTKNCRRELSNEYKVETIKNYAFENNIPEEEVSNFLYDYLHYIDSKKDY